MRKKILLMIVFSPVGAFVFAQQKAGNFRFHSINSLALMNGANEVSAGLQSVNGFGKGNWFAGVGAGIDYYLYRTVPVFADIRYAFGKSSNKFFAYADGGISIEWVEKFFTTQPIAWDFNSTSNFHSGPYTDAGVGYMVKMKKGGALVLSLGHSHKRLKETIGYLDWRTQQWFTTTNRYSLNRIVLKTGWRF